VPVPHLDFDECSGRVLDSLYQLKLRGIESLLHPNYLLGQRLKRQMLLKGPSKSEQSSNFQYLFFAYSVFQAFFKGLAIFGCHANEKHVISPSDKYPAWRHYVAKKGARVIVTLECTEARKEGKSPSRYTTTKNKKTTPDRLELKKYNPFLRRHTVHKEIK
jgi:large subunit ribosomal protein L33